jgi:hypothetical protein
MKMYSEAHLIFLREAYKHLSVPELTEAFNNAFKTSKQKDRSNLRFPTTGLSVAGILEILPISRVC